MVGAVPAAVEAQSRGHGCESGSDFCLSCLCACHMIVQHFRQTTADRGTAIGMEFESVDHEHGDQVSLPVRREMAGILEPFSQAGPCSRNTVMSLGVIKYIAEERRGGKECGSQCSIRRSQ